MTLDEKLDIFAEASARPAVTETPANVFQYGHPGED